MRIGYYFYQKIVVFKEKYKKIKEIKKIEKTIKRALKYYRIIKWSKEYMQKDG